MVGNRLERIRIELAARLLHGTVLGDRLLKSALHLYQRARTAVVLGFVSDEALERLGALAYCEIRWYRRQDESSWPELFDWERSFIEKHAPGPPARVLVGGAGAGREPYHLSQMGYEVTAFDPILDFARAMRRDMPSHLRVHAYWAKYEDLPRLAPVLPDEPAADLTALPAFDFGIFGWSSFSHIIDQGDRIRALETFATVIHGPILLSFFSRNPEADIPSTRLGRCRRRLPGRNQDPAFDFQINTGIYRGFTEEEMTELCNQADLKILESHIERGYSHSSWVVVCSVNLERS